jgi:hypothetical protein
MATLEAFFTFRTANLTRLQGGAMGCVKDAAAMQQSEQP